MTDAARPHVRAELMLPHQIDAALAARSLAYLPLGSLEYHSHHLPIGLDGLTAHGVCTRAAARSGGIVLPPLWFGSGGTHTTYPWTIMAGSGGPLRDLLRTALERLENFGIQVTVLFTGHFADEQLELIDTLAAEWNATRSAPRVLPLSVSRSDAHIPPDHAGVFETTLLAALHPDLVDLAQLPTLSELPANPAIRGSWDHRHDPAHPLWGVMGPDPRTGDLAVAGRLLDEIVSWTTNKIERAANGPAPR